MWSRVGEGVDDFQLQIDEGSNVGLSILRVGYLVFNARIG